MRKKLLQHRAEYARRWIGQILKWMEGKRNG